jgi:alkanesulfonate monooxygenase SsuD/methylene tetrahydromethanopterin reductase-like flavin-dependent oxidoreductase (luciferase family)
VAARDPGTFDWAVGIGANILSTPLSSPAAEVGFSARSSARPWPTIPRSAAALHDAAPDLRLRPPGDWELAVRTAVDYGRYFENLMQNIGTVKQRLPRSGSVRDRRQSRQLQSAGRIRENLMFGTPDEVIEKLQVYEDAGVDQYCLGLSFNLPFELQKKTLRLFIDEVMPHFAAREQDAPAAPCRAGYAEMGAATRARRAATDSGRA